MKKYLIPLIFTTSACAPTVFRNEIKQETIPQERFQYPYTTISEKTPAQVWSNLVDLIAVRGYGNGLNKENGLYTAELSEVPYAIEGLPTKNDTAALIILPRLKNQELSPSGKVRKSFTTYPEKTAIRFNVRIRPHAGGGTYINVNIPHITVEGGYNLVRSVLSLDTTINRRPAPASIDDWAATRSTGKLEKDIADTIK